MITSQIPVATLARDGGQPAVAKFNEDLVRWPLITHEDESAVLEVLRAGKMSGLDVTRAFEVEIAAWHGLRFALAHNTGTASLHAGMWACGVCRGDEVIGPSITYWASLLPALNLGARVVFADIDPASLTLDPADVERRITPRTKAIVAVHYCGHPCDMDPLIEIARRHALKLIEDASHAHGTLYKGRLAGTMGDVGCMSLMSAKALACGEGGMLLTNDERIYQRAAAFGHYERTGGPGRFAGTATSITDPELARFAGLPLGGFKYRMHQLSSAVGRTQLKRYRERMAEIERAMQRFGDLLDAIPGLRAHRVRAADSSMGGWYSPICHYDAAALNRLPVEKFCAAVRAEGVPCEPHVNHPLHLHPVFREADIYGDGRPANDVPTQVLSVSEAVSSRVFSIPWFKRDDPAALGACAKAFRKVALAAQNGLI